MTAVRWRRAFAGACLALAAATAGAAGADAFPDSAKAYVVRVDGRELWSAHADERLPPASLTKLMTALVVLEGARPADVVTVSRRAARARGTRVGLTERMRMSAEDLVVAMLLASANDACLALAEHAAGSAEAFVARMNQRARALGLARTSFADPCGFDAPGQRTTARDLARLADAFIAQPMLARIVATPARVVRAEDGRTFQVASTNALIGRVPGTIGVKTGYTAQAGRCLIGLVERDGTRVMVVLLGAGDRWWDAVAMIERAFESAKTAPSHAR